MGVLVGPHDRGLLSPALCAVVGGLIALANGVAWAAPATVDSSDGDGDGVLDSADRCPASAGLPPDGCAPRDTDGDHVVDSRDRCPEIAGPEVNGGCPDRDQDGDMVVDRRDKCLERFGHPDFEGCPPPDADGDAVPDPVDRCVSEPEVWNGTRDRDGCPDRGDPLVLVAGGRIQLLHADRLVQGDKALSKRGRRVVEVVVEALRVARARSVRLEVVAEYGLSYGDSLQRARRRAEPIRRALIAARKLSPAQVEVVCPGPDGKPRIVVGYR